MRFMVLVKADKNSEAGVLPDEKSIVAMGKFNEELVKAGVLLSAEGLTPSSKGARISFSGGKPVVTNGPFTEAKGLIAGFWMIQARSKEEAIEWFSRCPPEVGEIEVRQAYESEDFAPEIRTAEGRAVVEAERAFREREAR
jgi:hypothetical protein